MGEKLDLYRTHREEYRATRRPRFVEIGPARYLTVIGVGRPGEEPFQECIGALYAVAFTVKMASKAAGRDYAVCKLEGRWWPAGNGPANEPGDAIASSRYQLLIRTPAFIDSKRVAEAVGKIAARRAVPRLADVALEDLNEGRCVQILHVGPYEREAETLEAMRRFADDNGAVMTGLHHEIYLSDPRRTPPERLRTVLRHPVSG